MQQDVPWNYMEKFCQTKSEDDGKNPEITFTERSEFSEGELAEDSDETDNLQVKKTRKETTHQEKLKEIDDEMQVKIKELHKIISEGGLTKSTRLMDQCSESQR